MTFSPRHRSTTLALHTEAHWYEASDNNEDPLHGRPRRRWADDRSPFEPRRAPPSSRAAHRARRPPVLG